MISNELRNFINENMELIDQNTKESWEALFSKAQNTYRFSTLELWQMLLSADIDPFAVFGENKNEYVEYDPSYIQGASFYTLDVSGYNIPFAADYTHDTLGISNFFYDYFYMDDYFGSFYGSDDKVNEIYFAIYKDDADDQWYLQITTDVGGSIMSFDNKFKLNPRTMFHYYVNIEDVKKQAMPLVNEIIDQIKDYYKK